MSYRWDVVPPLPEETWVTAVTFYADCTEEIAKC
jgi:hypothetical protein